MRAYLLTTGTVFGLITVAHIWRIIAESRGLAGNPAFVLITLAAAGLSLWAWWLVRQSARER